MKSFIILLIFAFAAVGEAKNDFDNKISDMVNSYRNDIFISPKFRAPKFYFTVMKKNHKNFYDQSLWRAFQKSGRR